MASLDEAYSSVVNSSLHLQHFGLSSWCLVSDWKKTPSENEGKENEVKLTTRKPFVFFFPPSCTGTLSTFIHLVCLVCDWQPGPGSNFHGAIHSFWKKEKTTNGVPTWKQNNIIIIIFPAPLSLSLSLSLKLSKEMGWWETYDCIFLRAL